MHFLFFEQFNKQTDDLATFQRIRIGSFTNINKTFLNISKKQIKSFVIFKSIDIISLLRTLIFIIKICIIFHFVPVF